MAKCVLVPYSYVRSLPSFTETHPAHSTILFRTFFRSLAADFECFAHACRPMMIIRSAPFASVVRSLVCLFVRDLDQCGTVCWRRRRRLFSHSHSSRTRVCVPFFFLSLFTGFAKASSQRQSAHFCCCCCKLFAVILRIFVGFFNSSFSLIFRSCVRFFALCLFSFLWMNVVVVDVVDKILI